MLRRRRRADHSDAGSPTRGPASPFTPLNNGHAVTASACPFCAMNGSQAHYSITSSASTGNVGGTSTPIAFAVFRLKDDCVVLGLARDADPDAMRAAYRALAKKYRPDASVTENVEFATSFREISEAYSVLFLVALGCDLTCCAAKAHSR